MTIGQISKKYNISQDTLRYYEKIGLLKNIKKVNGKRNYSQENEKTLKFIICMKNAGFNLTNIIKFLTLYEQGNSTLDKRIEMLLKQKEKLQEEIHQKEKTMQFLNYKIDYYKRKKE